MRASRYPALPTGRSPSHCRLLCSSVGLAGMHARHNLDADRILRPDVHRQQAPRLSGSLRRSICVTGAGTLVPLCGADALKSATPPDAPRLAARWRRRPPVSRLFPAPMLPIAGLAGMLARRKLDADHIRRRIARRRRRTPLMPRSRAVPRSSPACGPWARAVTHARSSGPPPLM